MLASPLGPNPECFRRRRTNLERKVPSVIVDGTEPEEQEQSQNEDRPANTAAGPSSSSIRSNRLYLASRSERATEPILI